MCLNLFESQSLWWCLKLFSLNETLGLEAMEGLDGGEGGEGGEGPARGRGLT